MILSYTKQRNILAFRVIFWRGNEMEMKVGEGECFDFKRFLPFFPKKLPERIYRLWEMLSPVCIHLLGKKA